MADDETPDVNDEEEHRKPLSWGDLPSVVNIKDFAQMVGGELEQIGASFRLSLDSLFHLPFGPVVGITGLFIASVRSCLLLLVILVFGTGILLITLLRAAGVISRKRKTDSNDD